METLSHLPQIRVLGRRLAEEPGLFFWTGSGIECLFTGSQLQAEWRAAWGRQEPWVSVWLDGVQVARFPVSEGESRSWILRGMAPGRPKHIRIQKETQPLLDDPGQRLELTGLGWEGGDFLPLPAPRCRLEFVGDSITSGEGAVGAAGETDWTPLFFSADNYARMTADALGAEYRVVSQSGWGVTAGFDNDPRHAIPPYYTQVCGMDPAGRVPYDFSSWQPDGVVIHLGTNDDHAFGKPLWTDPVTGETSGLRCLADGRFDPASARRVEQAVCGFLHLVRQKNPGAVLIWCYGMMGTRLLPLLEGGVARYQQESGDRRVQLLTLPAVTDETRGALNHPGHAAHQAAARVLTRCLSGWLGL